MKEFLVAFFAAILTSILSWLIGEYKSYKAGLEEELAVLTALKCELQSLSKLFMLRANEYLEYEKNETLMNNTNSSYGFYYFRVSYNYMTVYESLGSRIGVLKNRTLIEWIICVYFDIKALYENLKDLEDLAIRGLENRTTKVFDNQLLVDMHKNTLDTLKPQLITLLDEVDKTIAELDKEIEIVHGNYRRSFISFVLNCVLANKKIID